MQAVILAGGLATRMRPLTTDTPKAMLEVAGRPFIAWQLERLSACGYERVLLCLGYLGEMVQAFVRDGAHFDLEVEYAFDGPRLLGTGGALRRSLDRLEPLFLVTYGDSYLPFDYAGPLRDLEQHPEATGTMSVFENAGRWDPSNTRIEGDRVLRYEKGSDDPALDHIDYGATALRREAVQRLPADEPVGLDTLQADLAREGRLRAYPARERFYEIGSEAGLRELGLYLSRTHG